jgi:hypothetical protein
MQVCAEPNLNPGETVRGMHWAVSCVPLSEYKPSVIKTVVYALTDLISPGWLSHYATSRKVAGSNSDEVTGIFNLPNPSSRTKALG